MRVYGASRRELFERFDKPALKPLPDKRYHYGDWKTARVSIDYHVEVDHHYYSVPHKLVGEKLDVRLTATTVEVFQRGVRVGSHARSYRRGMHTTVAEHMPAAHRAHHEWSPSRLVRWGQTVGPKTAALVEAILSDRPHPSRAIGPAWEYFAWSDATVASGSRQRARERLAPARAPTATSTRSSSTVSTVNRLRSRRWPVSPANCCSTRTSAAAATTTERRRIGKHNQKNR